MKRKQSVVAALVGGLLALALMPAGAASALPAQKISGAELASATMLVARRKPVCTRRMARAGLCRVRPSSATPPLRQPVLPGACPGGQMRVGKRCVGPVAAPPVRPVPQVGRCLGGSWMGGGCFCPGGGVARQLGSNFYSCGTPGECPGGGRRVGGICVRR
jgi:hypothetical protein